MEELKNEEVLTEEIQEETTEIFEPDYEDIIPAGEDESKVSNGAAMFVAGALVVGAVVGIGALAKKLRRNKKAKDGSGRYPWKEEPDNNDPFEDEEEPEDEEEETKKK